MVAILDHIYATKTVTNGEATFSALNPAGLPTFMDPEEGKLLARVVNKVQPRVSLEIGCAYGVSTLHICAALSAVPHASTHIVVDPFQRTKWHGVGLHNIEASGFSSFVRFIESRSETVLPQLLTEGTRLDFALIDGLHTFEQCMVEFFYLDRMLNPGGALVFDDADWPGINKVIRLALSYGNYTPIDCVGAPSGRHSPLGLLRTGLRRLPYSDRVIRRDVLYRPWDVGVAGTCVALEKTADHERPNGWHREF
jgi:predicted O-methyltransferase YrrM